MWPARSLRVLYRALIRILPRALLTRRMRASARVLEMTPAQREELARNLRAMLRPKAA
jgi:hypothetical protein